LLICFLLSFAFSNVCRQAWILSSSRPNCHDVLRRMLVALGYNAHATEVTISALLPPPVTSTTTTDKGVYIDHEHRHDHQRQQQHRLHHSGGSSSELTFQELSACLATTAGFPPRAKEVVAARFFD